RPPASSALGAVYLASVLPGRSVSRERPASGRNAKDQWSFESRPGRPGRLSAFLSADEGLRSGRRPADSRRAYHWGLDGRQRRSECRDEGSIPSAPTEQTSMWAPGWTSSL